VRSAIVLQHAPFEGPARIASILSDRGCILEVRRLDRGDAVPERIEQGQVLVVMGGSMGVGDVERPEFPYLRQEMQLLARCIREQAPVLGVCLGAQLLAAAAGATVRPMTSEGGVRVYEVGWTPVRFHRGTEADPILKGLPIEGPVLSWHGDAFALPPGARLLASTAVCPHQAFQLGARLFGLQFHCEAGAEEVDAFLRADEPFVTLAHGPDGVERIRRDTKALLAPASRIGERLLGNIFDAMT
jgi:GMP synthase-like glutamine amidotransferase